MKLIPLVIFLSVLVGCEHPATTGGGGNSNVLNGSWSPLNTGLPDSSNFKAIDDDKAGTIFAALSTGSTNPRFSVYKSTDMGTHWDTVGNQSISSTIPKYSIISKKMNSALQFVCTNGMITTDGGTWTSVATNDFVYSYVIEGSTIRIYGAGHYGVNRSIDYGATWDTVGLSTAIGNTIVAIRGAATASDELLVGTLSGFRRSSNSGNTWEPYKIGASVRSIAKLGNGYILAGTDGSQLYRSTDAGSNWSLRFTGPVTNQRINSIVSSGNVVYLALGGGGVYCSLDAGASWTQINSGLTSQNVNCLLIVNSTLFAGTTNGFFRYNPAS